VLIIEPISKIQQHELVIAFVDDTDFYVKGEKYE